MWDFDVILRGYDPPAPLRWQERQSFDQQFGEYVDHLEADDAHEPSRPAIQPPSRLRRASRRTEEDWVYARKIRPKANKDERIRGLQISKRRYLEGHLRMRPELYVRKERRDLGYLLWKVSEHWRLDCDIMERTGTDRSLTYFARKTLALCRYIPLYRQRRFDNEWSGQRTANSSIQRDPAARSLDNGAFGTGSPITHPRHSQRAQASILFRRCVAV
jgi:hypothetical protein